MKTTSSTIIDVRPGVTILATACFLVAGVLAAQGRPATPGGLPGAPDGLPPDGLPATCPGEIGAVLAEPGIDPTRLGLAMGLLGAGDFRLEGISLRAEGACGDPLAAEQGELVFASDWRERASGQSVALSQRKAPPHANVWEGAWASFWWHGDRFDVVVPLVGPMPFPVGGEGQPGPGDADALLGRVIAALAPGLGLDCFYRGTTGSWADLADLDLGDPRGQIPADLMETGFSLSFLAAPLAACGPDVPAPGRRLALSTSFGNESGDWLNVEVHSLAAGNGRGGELHDFGATWTSSAYQYSVFGARGEGTPLGAEVVTAIALALDPGFSAACLLQTVALTEADLPALGLPAARPPDGYTVAARSLTGRRVSLECQSAGQVAESFELFWSFAGAQGRRIDASASAVRVRTTGKTLPDNGAPGGVTVLWWQDEKGTYYSVSGYNGDGEEPVPTHAELIAVAQSMDPGFADDGLADGGSAG